MDRSCVAGGSGAPGERGALLEEFAGFLRGERSLVATTVENYLNQVRPFLAWYEQRRQAPLAGLTARDLNGFLAWRSSSCSPGSLTVAGTALRAWLRWMFLDGRLDRQLADAIGPVRYPARAGVPKALPAAGVASMLALQMSARDRALVLMLARLGLRCREAAGLLGIDGRGRCPSAPPRRRDGRARRRRHPGRGRQLLRHRSSDATAIYAKVDHDALGALVQPWPTTAQAL